MGVSWDEVIRWSAPAMQAVGDDLTNRLKKLQGTESELRDATTPREWDGEGASAAKESLQGIEQGLQNRVAEFAALQTAVDDAAERIQQLQRAIEEAQTLAQSQGLTIAAGKVAVRSTSDPAEPGSERERAQIAAKAAVEDHIEQIMRTALDIDADLCTVMLSITEGNIDDDGATTLAAAAEAGTEAGASTVADPPKNGTPADNKAWWDTLTVAERRDLINNRPELIGSRDGIPAVARDQANRELLADEKARLKAEERRLQAELDDNIFGGTFSNADAALEQVQEKLKGIEAIESKLERNEHVAENEGYYLLGFSSADDGRAIVAKGNPDVADNVATFVPGTGADLAGVGDLLSRGDKMWSAADRSDGSETTSVITWLGYDAPDAFHNAASGDYAQDARHSLDSFQDGLRATHEGDAPSHNTVIGHSYGSTVIGHTGRDLDLDVDKMVFVGSPGVGVDDVGGLNHNPNDVWATTAREDIIHEAPEVIHGNHPIDSDFGANTFDSDPGKGDWIWENIDTHSAYWATDNKSLENMGHLIVGNTDKVG